MKLLVLFVTLLVFSNLSLCFVTKLSSNMHRKIKKSNSREQDPEGWYSPKSASFWGFAESAFDWKFDKDIEKLLPESWRKPLTSGPGLTNPEAAKTLEIMGCIANLNPFVSKFRKDVSSKYESNADKKLIPDVNPDKMTARETLFLLHLKEAAKIVSEKCKAFPKTNNDFSDFPREKLVQLFNDAGVILRIIFETLLKFHDDYLGKQFISDVFGTTYSQIQKDKSTKSEEFSKKSKQLKNLVESFPKFRDNHRKDYSKAFIDMFTTEKDKEKWYSDFVDALDNKTMNNNTNLRYGLFGRFFGKLAKKALTKGKK